MGIIPLFCLVSKWVLPNFQALDHGKNSSDCSSSFGRGKRGEKWEGVTPLPPPSLTYELCVFSLFDS